MRLRLVARLVLAFALVSLLTSISAVYLMSSLSTANSEYQTVAGKLTLAKDLAELGEMLAQQNAAVRGYLLHGDQAYKQEYETLRTNMAKKIEQITPLLNDVDRSTSRRITESAKTYDAAVGKAMALAAAGDPTAPAVLKAEGMSWLDMAILEAGKLAERYKALSATATAEASKKTEASRNYGIVAVVVMLAISLFVGQAFARSIAGPLSVVTATAANVAAGDLTVKEVKINSHDEIGEMARAFNNMVQRLKRLIEEVGESAETVAGSSEELSAMIDQVADSVRGVGEASGQVASGAATQSKQIQGASQGIYNLGNSILQVAKGSEQLADGATNTMAVVTRMAEATKDTALRTDELAKATNNTMNVAHDGAGVVENTIKEMELIRASSLESADKIAELSSKVGQIGEITETIDSIASQTNLLALNAAIEAARAGEHGRGFAVVANEVRKLAERASSAAKQIADLIKNVQKGTKEAVNGMQRTIDEVQKGTQLASDAGDALRQILDVVTQSDFSIKAVALSTEQIAQASHEVMASVEAVAAVSEETTSAASEMATGSDQVLASIEQVAAVSEENAASAEEVSAAVEQMTSSTADISAGARNLSDIAQRLRALISEFKM